MMMDSSSIEWPVKTRELHNHHFDSTVWNDFKFRDDDIVIATYGKAGTTWTQQIVAQLLSNGGVSVLDDLTPWVDLRLPPKEIKLAMLEAQTQRRFLKTHLPADALVISPKAKYIYIARDGRDVGWSLYNHHHTAPDEWYTMINDSPGRIGPPVPRCTDDILEWWHEWFEKDGSPFHSFWDNTRTWWNLSQHLPNVKLLHFQNMKDDLPGMIREIAAFLDIKIDEEKFPEIVEHCTFDYMKKNQDLISPMTNKFF
jgi:aryl sulfotransferase